MSDDLSQLAERAWIYGYPLVVNLEQITRYVTTGVGANPPTDWNVFSHAGQLATPADTFVTINNDTIYSMGPIDLSVGPVRLDVPDTAGAYYVLQFIDAWTNNFAYVGKRATGTAAGSYLLTPPGWDGDVPEVMVQIRFPHTRWGDRRPLGVQRHRRPAAGSGTASDGDAHAARRRRRRRVAGARPTRA
jgi:hypothetical protein